MAGRIGRTKYVQCTTKSRARKHLAHVGALLTLCGVRMDRGLKSSEGQGMRTCVRCSRAYVAAGQ